MSNSIKPVSFVSLLGHNVAGTRLPSGFTSWTIPVYDVVQEDANHWYYLKTPVSGSVVAGWEGDEVPLEHDVTMIFPADKGDARDRAFTFIRTEKLTGATESIRVPVDLILNGSAQLVVGSLVAQFSESADSDPLASARIWTVPISDFMGGASNGKPNRDQYFVFLDGPGDSIRSDGGDATTAVSDDVAFIFPTTNIDAKGKQRKRGRTIDVRILNKLTGRPSTLEIPLDK